MRLEVILLSMFLCVLGSSNLRLLEPIPDYDSFVFAILWANNLCASSNLKCLDVVNSIEKNSFTIHGLWPAFLDGTPLKPCNDTAGTEFSLDQTKLKHANRMEKIWPSYGLTNNLGFWEYEYNKHGYCYVAKNKQTSYDSYFQKTIEIFDNKGYKDLFKRLFEGKTGTIALKFNELEELISKEIPRDSFQMMCRHFNKQQRLTELYISLGIDFKQAPINKKGSCDANKDIHIILS